jgi:hypothetical protein
MNKEENQLSKAKQQCPEAKGKKRHLPKSKTQSLGPNKPFPNHMKHI